jgi:hypothetical protein
MKILFTLLATIVISSFLYAQNVGIGTTTPATNLHILGATNADVITRTESVGTAGSASFQAVGNGGATDVFQMTRYNTTASGSVAGVNLANLSLLYTGMGAGPLLIDVISANKMQFATNNLVRTVIDANGKVQIGTNVTAHGLLALKATADTEAIYINQSGAGTIYGTLRIEHTGATDVPRVGILSTTIRSLADVNGVGIEGAGNSIGVQGLAEASTNSTVIGTQGESYGSGTYSIGVKGIATNYIGAPANAYGVYGIASGGTTNYAIYADGAMRVNGALSKASGTFEIDHPLDPSNKYLYHSFVESPDMMNIYNGNVTTDAKGIALVTLPVYFDALNKDFRYQLTAIGTFAQAIVSKEITSNNFEIKTSLPNVKVSWQVTGVRQDAWANAHRVVAEVEKESFNKGKYLHPQEFGLSNDLRIGGDIQHNHATGAELPEKNTDHCKMCNN